MSERCPHCGADLPGEVAFCPSCGTALSVTTSEERRFLTVLFADLVGFTAHSDEADPEDVRARLVPYHHRVRQEIERYDGTVEKLIGDGVMAVFGAPIAHEDDPERAVRTALRIQQAVDELNAEHEGLELTVRIGINSGEAVVTHGGKGERIVGDVVNTASRIESVAPPGGVLVGESTHRATDLVIEYDAMDPVEVKGKARPLRVWLAVEPRGRYGVDAAVRANTPFLGRESEMSVLKETYLRVVEGGTHHLVTIAAAPGVGKSRLVNEFWRWADDRPEIVWWRQGRCLPYGEGITFWALGEIVKGQAGILESDTAEAAAGKLETALEALGVADEDREWLAAQLGGLVGTEGDVGADRSEAFAAWRRFLQDLAAVRPLIMVVEDLHWADPALIEFLEDLLVWAAESPIMVICTARPELYENHRAWGGGRRNSATISLAPLGDDHIAALLAALLDQAVLPAETQRTLLDRAGGNPLYAEEFVRMLADRGMLAGRGRLAVGDAAAVPVPESVQTLIGSRLDLLSDSEARVVENAAVAGKVFWDGALDALGDGGDVPGALRSLVAREWIRPVRVSSIERQREYAFWHALTRDVAYGRIPRAARASKHRRMAKWIESIGGERAFDQAELLAHHYRMALEYAEASGDRDTAAIREDVIRSSTMAGDRALRLDARRAHDYYHTALEMMGEGHAGRPRVMIKAGKAAEDAGLATPIDLYERAAELAEAEGDQAAAAEALVRLQGAKWFGSGVGAGTEDLDRAIEMMESGPPTAALAEAYNSRAGHYMMRGLLEEELEWAQKGIELAERLKADGEHIRGLEMRGIALFHLGDVEAGLADLRRALEIAEDRAPDTRQLQTAHVNLADHLWFVDGPAAAMQIFQRGLERVTARGGDASWTRAETMWVNFDLGAWDDVIATADELVEQWAIEPSQFVPWAQSFRAAVHVWRGEVSAATALQETYLPALRDIGDLQLIAPGLLIASRTELARERRDAAKQLLMEFLDVIEGKSPIYQVELAAEPVRLLVAVGQHEEAGRVVDGFDRSNQRAYLVAATGTALVAEATGDTEAALAGYREAAASWAEYGVVLEEALARLGVGRCLSALGESDQGAKAVSEAQVLLDRLGVAPAIAGIDADPGETMVH